MRAFMSKTRSSLDYAEWADYQACVGARAEAAQWCIGEVTRRLAEIEEIDGLSWTLADLSLGHDGEVSQCFADALRAFVAE